MNKFRYKQCLETRYKTLNPDVITKIGFKREEGRAERVTCITLETKELILDFLPLYPVPKAARWEGTKRFDINVEHRDYMFECNCVCIELSKGKYMYEFRGKG